MLTHLKRDETGATAIEYGLIIALIALAAVGAMGTLGNTFSDVLSEAEVGMRN